MMNSSDHSSFAQDVAIVTGGASGIGEACARQLVSRGAAVCVADSNGERAEKLAAELGSRAMPFRLDVTDPHGCDDAVTQTIERFGKLTLAVNSAGIGVPEPAPVGEMTFSQWRKVLGVNLDGVFNSMSSEIRGMLQNDTGGSIVNVASVFATVGSAGASPYAAAKHAVVGLTKSAALEHASANIRVNAVGPGHVRTAMFDAHDSAFQQAVIARYPIGRIADVDEVARFICVIAGRQTSFATGAFYPLDGGFTAA